MNKFSTIVFTYWMEIDHDKVTFYWGEDGLPCKERRDYWPRKNRLHEDRLRRINQKLAVLETADDNRGAG